MINDVPHVPVMINEVLTYLRPKDEEIYLDCTFGAGGYTKAILESANCSVIGIDRDSNTEQFVANIQNSFPNRFSFFNIKYSEVANILNGKKVNGIVLDLGVSSMQIDNTNRGFSFSKDFQLDMRMGKNKISAFDVVNNYNEKDLANIIYNYGDEVKSRHIAKRIVELRKKAPIKTTLELANIIRYFYPNSKSKIDSATKTFQAIRIEVNEELSELNKILNLSKDILVSGGRLITVSFHSLEDGMVKNFIKANTNKGKKKDKYSQNVNETNNDFNLLTNKAVSPTSNEINSNIRARSAKLRALEKC